MSHKCKMCKDRCNCLKHRPRDCTGCSDCLMENYSTPLSLLKLALFVLNQLPRVGVNHDDFADTYQVAEAIDQYLQGLEGQN